jgi:hypothetical protein
VTHSVCIAAESLYEAAARGVAEFKRTGFALAEIGPDDHRRGAHRVARDAGGEVGLRLTTNGKTPREQAMKVALRQLLGWG